MEKMRSMRCWWSEICCLEKSSRCSLFKPWSTRIFFYDQSTKMRWDEKNKHYIQINFVKMVTLIWLSMFVNVTIDWWLSFSNLFQMLIHSTIIHSAVSKVRFKKFPTNKARKIVMNPNFRPRSLSNWMLQAWWWQRYLWHHQHSQILLWHSRCPTRWNMYPWRLLTTETFPICSNK